MFQRFSRSEHPRAKGGGSGLGLSIVHMLVGQHGGRINVDESTLGGTRFTIRLPLLTA